MKFTVIFAFFALMAACIMLPAAKAAAIPEDSNPMLEMVSNSEKIASSVMDTVGKGLNKMFDAGTSMVKKGQETTANGMSNLTKNLASLVPSGTNAATRAEKKE